MSYQQLSEFDKACILGKLGKTTRYLGDVTTAFKRGVIHRQAPITNLMKTEKTWRACRNCCRPGHSRTVVIENINGLLTEQKCSMCKGTGMVYG